MIVVSGDGQVPHPPVMGLGSSAAIGDRDRAVSGLEMLALLKLAGGNPLLQGRCVDWTKDAQATNPRTR